MFTCTKRTSDKMVFQTSVSDSLFTMSCKSGPCPLLQSFLNFLQSEMETSYQTNEWMWPDVRGQARKSGQAGAGSRLGRRALSFAQ